MLQGMRFLMNLRKGSRLIATQKFYFSKDIPDVTTSSIPLAPQEIVSPRLLKMIEKRLKEFQEPIDVGGKTEYTRTLDELQKTIITMVNVDQIKSFISLNFREMQSYHIVLLMETVNNIILTSSNAEQIKQQLLQSREFEIFLNRALKMANQMYPDETIKCLTTLMNLDIQVDTLIFMAYLQMSRYQINKFSVPQLYILYQICETTKDLQIKTPLIKAINMALRFAVKHRILQKEVDFESPEELFMLITMIKGFGVEMLLDESDHSLYLVLDSLNRCFKNLSESQRAALPELISGLNLDSEPLSHGVLAKIQKKILKSKKKKNS